MWILALSNPLTMYHNKLISYVVKVIHDGDTESLIRKYLKAVVMNNEVYELTKIDNQQRGKFITILSNIMLNELDEKLKNI